MSKKNHPKLIILTNDVFAKMSNDTKRFPAPPVGMTIFKEQIDALAAAQQLTGTRARGTASARDGRVGPVWTSLGLLVAYVQSLADASPESAVEIIEAAGMKVAAETKRFKPLLAVSPRPNGAAYLVANVGALARGRKPWKNRFFSWQFSTNGGQTWSTPVTTPRGHATLTGLPQMTNLSFRVTVTDGDGQAAWSPAVPAFLV